MTEIVFLSLKVAMLAMVLVLPLALLTGYFLSRSDFAGKAIVSALVHLPLVLPPVVTGYGLLLLFGKRGWIGQYLDAFGWGVTFSWVGAAIAAAVMAFPLVVRPVRLAFEQIEPGYEDIAATLGASGWRRFYTILLPLSWPGILAGLVLGFAKALGEFGATITFVSNIPGETQTLSLAVYTLLQSPLGDRQALMLIGVSVTLSVLAVLASEFMLASMTKRREK